MKKAICSYCGKKSVTTRDYEVELSEPYSDIKKVTLKENICSYCGFSEDNENNDIIVNKELAELKRISMIKILESLNALGYTNAAMERILGLPPRTLARWKNVLSINPSAAAIALLRIIRTYPWILEIAEKHFDPNIVRVRLIENAAYEMMKIGYENPVWKFTSGSSIKNNYFEFFVKGYKEENQEVVSGENYTLLM